MVIIGEKPEEVKTFTTNKMTIETQGFEPSVTIDETDITYIEPYPKHHNFIKAMVRGCIINERNYKFPSFSNVRIRFKQVEKALKIILRKSEIDSNE